MKQISKIGQEMLAFQDKLAAEFKYKPIEPDLFLGDVRNKYQEALPKWCVLTGDLEASLCSLAGTILCSGYERIVIGDYGAFIEITPEKMCTENLCCKSGQEYRYQNPRFTENIKYLWLTTKDKSECKIYLQRKRVAYADYIPGMYYVSPYEVYKEE